MAVHCTVSNCQWWQQNHCMAEGILVTGDNLANKLPDGPDFPDTEKIVQQYGGTPVKHCMESCCKTFTPKKG